MRACRRPRISNSNVSSFMSNGSCAWNAPATRRRSCAVVTKRRSEEHTSELQSLMRISYAVFCLKKKSTKQQSELQHYTSSRIESSTGTKTLKSKYNRHKEHTTTNS